MAMVTCWDVTTLLPLIQQHVHPGTLTHSDEWETYIMSKLPSVSHHNTFNHSVTFVMHTQNIESYWNTIKTMFKCMKGVHEEVLSSYLDEFM